MTDVLDRTKIYINGAWVESAGTGRIDVLNPATGEVIAQVAEGTTADVDAAVEVLLGLDAVRRDVAFDEIDSVLNRASHQRLQLVLGLRLQISHFTPSHGLRA